MVDVFWSLVYFPRLPIGIKINSVLWWSWASEWASQSWFTIHDVLLCWQIGWRLICLFFGKGIVVAFQPPCLPLSPLNSLSLSRDTDVQRRLRARLQPELDCSVVESKAALNRPRAATALLQKQHKLVWSWVWRRIAYVMSRTLQFSVLASCISEWRTEEENCGKQEIKRQLKETQVLSLKSVLFFHHNSVHC